MPRIPSLDLARGATVLAIPSIHTVLLYGDADTLDTVVVGVLGFIAEWPGAQLFMLLMGVSMVLSKKTSWRSVRSRSVLFFILGLALNYAKFVLPAQLGLLPHDLLTELSPDYPPLLLGDILFFAAITYPLLYGLTRVHQYPFIAACLTVVILVISPYCWDIKTGLPFADYLLSLLGGHPPAVFFPVFPWLIYPLTGLILGHLLKYHPSKYILNKAGLTGLSLMAIGLILPGTEIKDWPLFYRTGAGDSLLHLGFIGGWLWLSELAHRYLPDNPLYRLLNFCSRHITVIYLVQWPLICWLLPVFGYLQSGPGMTLLAAVLITSITLLLTFGITHETHLRHPRDRDRSL